MGKVIYRMKMIKSKKYVILGSHTDYCECMCHDVIGNQLVYFENRIFTHQSGILSILYKIHMSTKINNMVSLPLKNLWYKFFLDENNLHGDDEIFVIIFDSNIHFSDWAYLLYLKRKYQIRLVGLFMNPSSYYKTGFIEEIKRRYDLVITTDGQDAISFDLLFIPGIYSKIQIEEKNKNLESDILFVGAAKDRIELLHEVYLKLCKENVVCDFTITNVLKQNMLSDATINYNMRIGYAEVLERVGKTNCILEVLQNSQSGVTLRTLEAITYNKKLLTNNVNVMNSSFYDERFIRVFHNIEDIDIDFITDKIDVKYEYTNEFSPNRLLELVEEYLC